MQVANETVHKSVHITPSLNRKVAVRLAKDGKTFSQVVREALEQYAGSRG